MSKRRIGRVFAAVAALSLLGPAGALAAQEPDERDCRCVGPDGAERENCICILTPDVDVRGFSMLIPPRARIGVSLREDTRGARVAAVMDDSPAEEAGLREGDVITRVAGRSLFEPLDDRERERRLDEDEVAVGRLMAFARDWEPGAAVELEVLRDGETLTVTVEPEESRAFGMSLPGGQGMRLFGRDGARAFGGEGPRLFSFRGPDGRGFMELLGDSMDVMGFRGDDRGPLTGFFREGQRLGRLDPCFRTGQGWVMFGADCVDGVRLVDLNPDLGAYFGATSGALVAEAAEGTTLGLRAGDVILAIGGREVADAEDARRILASYDDDETITMRIVRHQERLEVGGSRR